MKKKVIIFGCGIEGKRSFSQISSLFDVAAFSDNNPSLWGTILFDVPVISPVELANYKGVSVVICIASGFIDAAKQVEAMGLPCMINRYGVFYEYRDTILYPMTFSKAECFKKTVNDEFAILFVQESPCGRTDKTSYVIKQKGVITQNAYFRDPSKMPDAYCKENAFYSYDDLLDFVNKSDFDIVHCSNEPDILTNLLVHSNKPVVFDTHDLLTARKNSSSREIYYYEYAANKFADGNMYVGEYYRDLQVERYGVRADRTFILPNIPLESQLPFSNQKKPKLSASDGELHIVYEGGISDDPASNRFFEDLWKSITGSNIHIHYYSQVNIAYCKALEQTSPYLHYEGNLSSLELVVEMTQYDIGSLLLNPVDKNADMSYPNKLYEYLAAGLPIVSNLTQPLIFLKSHKVGGALDFNGDIKAQLQEYAKMQIPSNFLRENKLIMESYADAILSFYKKIIEHSKGIKE